MHSANPVLTTGGSSSRLRGNDGPGRPLSAPAPATVSRALRARFRAPSRSWSRRPRGRVYCGGPSVSSPKSGRCANERLRHWVSKFATFVPSGYRKRHPTGHRQIRTDVDNFRHRPHWAGRGLADNFLCGSCNRSKVLSLGWHAAALHCAASDRRIGWTSLQRRQRLFLVCNHSRFLIVPEASGIACLASRQHRHSLVPAETLVDPSRFAGTCYRAANRIQVGSTRGFGRTRGVAIGYVEYHLPKRVVVYPLRNDARRHLAGEQFNPDWRPFRQRTMPTPSQRSSLREFLS